ncbi:hypothetical protein [Verticiella alkaliphila]|uniref:hypothetical protein n=1 Tax=Verticiella alkaliphila TaxID=2779529 RepID=UPI001C0BE12B|nr:hypothetical protein [Verticiella sp. GG226]
MNNILLPAVISALLALSPSPAHAQSAAQFEFISNDFRADLTVSQSPPGACRSGFSFDARWGGCVRQSSESGAESRSCPAGQTGTQRRTRSRTVYTHQNGGVQQGSWSSWSSWTGTCTTPAPVTPPAPPTPTPGTQFPIPQSISAMICSSGDPGYSSGGNSLIQSAYRNQLISYYRSFGIAGRCPESSGYSYWLSDWWSRASNAANGPFHDAGGSAAGLQWSTFVNGHMPDAWDDIKRAIDASAARNDEAGQGGVSAANGLCQRAANAAYGAGKTTATYILKSGNQCRVTAVH